MNVWATTDTAAVGHSHWPLRDDVFASPAHQSVQSDRLDEYYADEADTYDEFEELGEVESAEADSAPVAEVVETTPEFETTAAVFPSGLVLLAGPGPTGPREEHWDPNHTDLPLYYTGPDVRAKKLATNFTVGELVTSGGRGANRARISPELVECLQAIRHRIGRPVRIISGYRSWARNAEVYRGRGRTPTLSRHCSGQAADIAITGLSGMQIAKLAVDVGGGKLGIGVGRADAHIDVRGRPDTWTYLKGAEHVSALNEITAYRANHRHPLPAPAPQPGPTPKPGTRPVPAHVSAFIAKYRPHAEASQATSGIPWLVTLGQAALESNWGRQTCGENLFGIKAKSTMPESQRKLCRTREVESTPDVSYPEVLSVTRRADGRYDYVVKDWFRAFASPVDSFDQHARVLKNPRYAKAFEHTDDPYAFAREVAKGGYATAPNYASALSGVMKLIERATEGQ